MSQLTLNAEPLAKLPTLHAETVIVDEKGRPLGYYTPIDPTKLEPHITEQEMERREKSDKWYSTAAVLAHLEKL